MFRFRLDDVAKTHSLLSTDPTNNPPSNTDTGHYAVLLAASASDGASRLKFEFNVGGGSPTTKTFVVPGALSTSADYHLVISFKTDANTFAGDTTGVGVLRCFWNGVACVLSGTSDKFVAATIGGAGIGYSGSANWPLFLGQYLDGAVNVGDADALFHFDNSLADAAGGSAATNPGPTAMDVSTNQAVFTNTTAYRQVGNQVLIPTPFASGGGTGDFTFECFITVSQLGHYQPVFGNMGGVGNLATDGTIGAFSLLSMTDSGGNSRFWFYTKDSNGSWMTKKWTASGAGGSILGVKTHVALVRTVSGATSTWRLYVNGVHATLDSGTHDTNGACDVSSFDFALGRGSHNASIVSAQYITYDECRIVKSDIYGVGSGNISPVPSGAFADPIDAADNFFDGKMDEFAVYNGRCLHDTSETFQVPAAPTRGTPLTQTSGMDSEGSHGTILTTKNTGVVLPRSIEGLSSGSAWNDSGTVKVVP